MKNITKSLESVLQQIRMAEAEFGRDPGSVRLVAVSKTRQVEEILSAINAGQLDFGENYIQEALDKIRQIQDEKVIWHYIGPIQSNKTRSIAENFHWVHSVDRIKIAKRLSQARPEQLPPLNICLQVNISMEKTKSGTTIEEIPGLLGDCTGLPGIRIRGLMAMPQLADDFSEQRQSFHKLNQFMQELKQQGYSLDTLSIGTSADFRAAIAEGSTMVRIGTTIFGPRD